MFHVLDIFCLHGTKECLYLHMRLFLSHLYMEISYLGKFVYEEPTIRTFYTITGWCLDCRCMHVCSSACSCHSDNNKYYLISWNTLFAHHFKLLLTLIGFFVRRCWRSGTFPLCDGTHVKHNKATGDNVGPLLVKK